MTSSPQEPAETVPPAPPAPKDPLRSSKVGRFWTALAALVVLLVFLVVFVAQNTEQVSVSFLGWDWHPPLAVALLIATALGLAISVAAGTLRIWQLHRRVRRTD